MENFIAMDVQSAAVKVMETVNIIATSKKIETIISRYSFLVHTLPTLEKYRLTSQYSNYIQQAKEQYASMYPNRPIADYQQAILEDPNGFSLDNFYCQALVAAMQRFVNEQVSEIESLKTENSKQKRRIKVNETIQKAISELGDKLGSSVCFESSLEQLRQLTLSTN